MKYLKALEGVMSAAQGGCHSRSVFFLMIQAYIFTYSLSLSLSLSPFPAIPINSPLLHFFSLSLSLPLLFLPPLPLRPSLFIFPSFSLPLFSLFCHLFSSLALSLLWPVYCVAHVLAVLSCHVSLNQP